MCVVVVSVLVAVVVPVLVPVVLVVVVVLTVAVRVVCVRVAVLVVCVSVVFVLEVTVLDVLVTVVVLVHAPGCVQSSHTRSDVGVGATPSKSHSVTTRQMRSLVLVMGFASYIEASEPASATLSTQGTDAAQTALVALLHALAWYSATV